MHLTLLATWITLGKAIFVAPPMPVDSYQSDLKQLLQQLLWGAQVERCLAVITDEIHYTLYDRVYFESVGRQPKPYFLLRVNENQDLYNPSQEMELVLGAIKSSRCDLHVITLLNGWQVEQLLKFVYDTRALQMQQKFVLLHDARLFEPEMFHIWNVFVKTVFLKRMQHNSYTISCIAYPGILSGVLVLKQLLDWAADSRINGTVLFKDKTGNLLGAQVAVAIAVHLPMIHLNKSTNKYQGVEIEIVEALAKSLNFRIQYYNANESDSIEWEQSLQENETHLDAGPIGELAHHNALFGIGDLHLFQSYVQHVELSIPHSVECLTFLTPESSADNSWQTFILPFSGGMWAGVLLSLFIVGTIFYLISFFNALLLGSSPGFFRCLRRQKSRENRELSWRRLSLRIELSRYRKAENGIRRDIFDDYANCILFTYSMLLYVALPRMPRNWPLRVLTGWYWIYCILLVATYRASFTAILANPAERITIDTLEDLNTARIPLATGAAENKQFLKDSSDEVVRELGSRMEIIDGITDLVDRIAVGRCAYYDNEFYLRFLRVSDERRSVGSSALHIMKECVVHMPVVLALEKNSALKPRVDDIIQRLSEGGLIAKWLRDAVNRLPAEEQVPQEALMNLSKFWSSFVALFIGYLTSIGAVLIELWHFKYIVMRHPLYDVYNPSLYYNFKRLYPDK